MNYDVADMPLLPDYISITEAATELGVSKQAVHGMIRSGEFESARKIKLSESNYLYVLLKTEVEQLVAARARRSNPAMTEKSA